MDYKKQAAQKAAELIQTNTVIGFGAGSAMAHMVAFLKEKVETGLTVKVVTSSFTTRMLLLQNNFEVQDTATTSSIDIYFDGCDQFDKNLNALKSGGGIHTNEKILAVMANEFILVGDDSKYVEKLEVKFPVVIEVLPQIVSYLPPILKKMYPGVRTELRMSNKKDGAVISDNGNYIFDLWFEELPELATINPTLKNIAGVIETSLFYDIAKRAVIAGGEGIRVLEKA
ncbi:MAG: ribose 5-phosphate isomerase A [Chitinophagaceae bacterium]